MASVYIQIQWTVIINSYERKEKISDIGKKLTVSITATGAQTFLSFVKQIQRLISVLSVIDLMPIFLDIY